MIKYSNESEYLVEKPFHIDFFFCISGIEVLKWAKKLHFYSLDKGEKCSSLK